MSLPTIIIDVKGVRDVKDFWERYVIATRPEKADLFGRNLDAFWDAAEGGGPGYPGKVALHFVNMSSVRTLPNGEAFLSAFAEIATDATTTSITWED